MGVNKTRQKKHAKNKTQGEIMTGFSSADLCKLSLQEIADILLDKLDEVDQETVGCKVYGCNGNRMFELRLLMQEVKGDDNSD